MAKNFWGIDVGGSKGTIAARIFKQNGSLCAELIVVNHVNKFWKEWNKNPGPVSIDAPLTYSPNKDNGFRFIDIHWKESVVNEKHKSWVLSPHSLLAIPLKGLWLLNGISKSFPVVECHPRIGMALLLKKSPKFINALESYKAKHSTSERRKSRKLLWNQISKGLKGLENIINPTDDQIDALFCALVCMEANKEETPLKMKVNGLRFENYNKNDEEKFEWLPEIKQMKAAA